MVTSFGGKQNLLLLPVNQSKITPKQSETNSLKIIKLLIKWIYWIGRCLDQLLGPISSTLVHFFWWQRTFLLQPRKDFNLLWWVVSSGINTDFKLFLDLFNFSNFISFENQVVCQQQIFWFWLQKRFSRFKCNWKWKERISMQRWYSWAPTQVRDLNHL